MKRFLSALGAIVFVFVFCFSSFAATVSASLSASASSVRAGDSVTVTVKVSGCSSPSLGIIPSFDTAAFDLVSGEWLVSGALLSDFSDGIAVIAFASANSFNGNVFRFVLKAKTSAKVGAYTVKCEISSEGYTSANPSLSLSVACATHQWSGWTQTKAPSCGVKGSETRTCSACGAKETRDVAASEHSWSSWNQTAAPSCTANGTESRTCSLCKKTETRSVSATGHAWGSWETTTAPDCENAGEQTRVCSHDASHVETKKLPALGHSFDQPKIVREATISEPGLMQGVCKVCGKTTEQEIPCKAADAASGIEIETEKGAFASGTTLAVTKIDSANEAYETVKTALASVSDRFEIYDVSALLNGNAAQPKKGVSLHVPVPSGYGANAELYAIAEDGTVTKLDATLSKDGKTISADVAALGRLAVVDSSAKQEVPSTDTPTDRPVTTASASVLTDSGISETEKGGFNPLFAVIPAVAVVAVAVILFFVLKKKKGEKQ